MQPENRRILIVDDEPMVLSALKRSLRREGYTLQAVGSPAEALELVASTPFDLVLSDHLMPGMTGLQLLKRVREIRPDTIRMMLTGHADIDTAIAAINEGEIYRFLMKPWDDLELKISLHIAFEQLDLERENARLIATVRRQYELIQELEREHPGISSINRDPAGAYLIEELSEAA